MHLAIIFELLLSLEVVIIALQRFTPFNQLNTILNLHDFRWVYAVEFYHSRLVSHLLQCPSFALLFKLILSLLFIYGLSFRIFTLSINWSHSIRLKTFIFIIFIFLSDFRLSIKGCSNLSLVRNFIGDFIFEIPLELWPFEFDQRAIIVECPPFLYWIIFLEKVCLINPSELNVWNASFPGKSNDPEHICRLLGLLCLELGVHSDSSALLLDRILYILFIHSFILGPLNLLTQIKMHGHFYFFKGQLRASSTL